MWEKKNWDIINSRNKCNAFNVHNYYLPKIVTFIVLGTRPRFTILKQINPVTDVSVVFTVIINVLVTPFTYSPIKPGIVDSSDGSKSSSVPLFRIMPQEGIVLLPSTWHVIFLGELMGIYNGPVGVNTTKIQQQQLKIVYSNVSFNCCYINWSNA